MCGENFTEDTSCLEILGSSPRVRGKLIDPVPASRTLRLIPACAGKTERAFTASTSHEAHPRVCGENREIEFGGWYEQGSSPRVRGKLPMDWRTRSNRRLIPACAGKTASGSERRSQSRAHPRVCGENKFVRFVKAPLTGSSPRVRGKLPRPAAGTDMERLIPACAGKTQSLNHALDESKAHPRVCGENAG